MPRFKDWKKGEYRINLEAIDPAGGKIEAYLPRVPKKSGEALVALVVEISLTAVGDYDPGPLVKAVLRAVAKRDREEKRKARAKEKDRA